MAGAVGGVPKGVTDKKPYIAPHIPQVIPDATYRQYVADRRLSGQPMSDYKAYADTTRGSAQHFGRVRGTDGEWLKGPDDRYIRQYPDPTESQLGQLDPGYMSRHPSERDLPSHRRTGSRAVYGKFRDKPIHGPADQDMYFTDWPDVGVQHDPLATPFISGKPVPRNEERYFREKGFKFKEQLGRGGYGTVWLVHASQLFKDSKGEFYKKEIACKVMNIATFQRLQWTLQPAVKKLVAEATVHSDLRHSNIVECHYVYYTHDPHTGFPYCRCFMFMELCKGDLRKIMRKQWFNFYRFKERQAFDMFDQVSAGLQYLHNKGIAHLDLKIYNVLYVKKEKKLVYKLTDFGLSFQLNCSQQATMTGSIGTSWYMPPEMSTPMTWNVYLADIYSLACILAESLSGVGKHKKLLDEISFRNWTPTALKKWGIRQSCADLINEMTQNNFNNRPNIDQVRQHQWFVDMRI